MVYGEERSINGGGAHSGLTVVSVYNIDGTNVSTHGASQVIHGGILFFLSDELPYGEHTLTTYVTNSAYPEASYLLDWVGYNITSSSSTAANTTSSVLPVPPSFVPTTAIVSCAVIAGIGLFSVVFWVVLYWKRLNLRTIIASFKAQPGMYRALSRNPATHLAMQTWTYLSRRHTTRTYPLLSGSFSLACRQGQAGAAQRREICRSILMNNRGEYCPFSTCDTVSWCTPIHSPSDQGASAASGKSPWRNEGAIPEKPPVYSD